MAAAAAAASSCSRCRRRQCRFLTHRVRLLHSSSAATSGPSQLAEYGGGPAAAGCGWRCACGSLPTAAALSQCESAEGARRASALRRRGRTIRRQTGTGPHAPARGCARARAHMQHTRRCDAAHTRGSTATRVTARVRLSHGRFTCAFAFRLSHCRMAMRIACAPCKSKSKASLDPRVGQRRKGADARGSLLFTVGLCIAGKPLEVPPLVRVISSPPASLYVRGLLWSSPLAVRSPTGSTCQDVWFMARERR